MGDRGSSAKAASGDRHRPQQRMEGEEPRQERQQTAAEVQADDDYHVDPIELQKAQQWMEIMRQPPDARKIPQSLLGEVHRGETRNPHLMEAVSAYFKGLLRPRDPDPHHPVPGRQPAP